MRANPTDTSVDTLRSVLLGELANGFDKRSWHGPNLAGSFRGLSAAEASARVAGRKSIWEQVLHAAYWKQRVLNKVTGTSGRLPRKGSNWPTMPTDLTEAAWRADVELLHDVHRQLVAAVAALPADRLDHKTVWLLHGAAAHDVYHAGQIRLLRRLQGL